ncbi:MAG: TIGR03943 family putative permease subunit [Anaerocolumna sp.]
MRGNKNIEVLIQMIILVSIALFLTFLLVTNKINYYVHPRYRLGIWACAVTLFLLAFRLIFELRKGRHNSNSRKYAIYMIPLVFAIVFPVVEGGNANKVIAESANSSVLDEITNLEDKTESSLGDSEDENALNDSVEYDYLFDEDGSTYEEPEDKSLKYPTEMIDGVISISEEYFASWYYDLYDYLEDFKGKRYQFLAQVYSMEGLGEDEFLAGRYIMVCCATDLTGYGIVCKSDFREELKEDQWILVTATIDEYDYNGTKIPYLADPVIEKAEAPADEYVYYNFY